LLPAVASSVIATLSFSKMKAVCCLCCGREKTGELHPGDGAANKQGYCKLPDNEQHQGWVVPAGYAIGDTRGKADTRAIKWAWKRRKEELGILDEQQFDGWPYPRSNHNKKVHICTALHSK
jgi:hypothetical protein